MSIGLYPNDVMLPLRTCQDIPQQSDGQPKRAGHGQILQSSLIWCNPLGRISQQPAELPPLLMRLYSTLLSYIAHKVYKCAPKRTKGAHELI